MHRVQAGSRNAQGWYDAQSTEGHFSISLPIPFNDFTVRGKDKNGKESISYCEVDPVLCTRERAVSVKG